MIGGIDLGGTKIEACLFDAGLTEIARRRVPTPADSFEALLDALVALAHYDRRSGTPSYKSIPVRIRRAASQAGAA